MPLTPGTRIGSYEIQSGLGAGGMGEVWRARDTKLGRDVALKILPEAFARDPDRLARFEREAQVLASLNHPNIATIHGVEDSGAVRALVLELVEGPTLADRIARGPIPLDEALAIATEIGAGLHAAHDHGIVHRDLKPANVKLRSDGVVKVLDFGLAKALVSTVGADHDSQPTITSPAFTTAGVILGTAAYMSPEQARGQAVDKRADIWAFGAVLFEMLSGKRPFRGDTTTDVLAEVVGKEPDWRLVPPSMQRLLRSCLQKDPKHRLHDIADVPLLLDAAGAPVGPAASSKAPWAVTAVFGVAAGLAAWAPWSSPTPPAEVARLQILPPENVDTANMNFTVSPDGRKLAFLGIGPDGVARIWIRMLDSLDARELPGSETRRNAPPAFWSPDSRFIAYSAPEGKLKRVDLVGSPPQALCDTTGPNAVGGSWSRDGVLVFGSVNAGITRVSASGGTPSAVTILDASRKETRHAYPVFLEDGRRFLYLRTSMVPEYSGVYLGSLDRKPEEQDAKLLIATAIGPFHVSPSSRGGSRLLFQREGTLWSQSFDDATMELVGDPVSVAQQVGINIAAGSFSASGTGVLVYRVSRASQDGRLIWLNRGGLPVLAPEQPGGISALALSPDGERVALVRQDAANPQNRDVWTWETTGSASTRVTFDPRRDGSPLWSADGVHLIFASNRDGPSNLYRKLANESKDEDILLKTGQDKSPTSVSADGRWLLFTQVDPQTKSDVWLLASPAEGRGDQKPTAFLRGESNENSARFSPGPDARWVAYVSDESGRNEVYVREFPLTAAGRRWALSTAGGVNPRWRGDGRELFFAALDGTVMSVDVTPGVAFQVAAPKTLFKVPAGILPNWDVTPDGKRFLALMPVEQEAQTPYTIVQNWQAALSR